MCHLQVGAQSKVAIVLSCPGQAEMKAGYPAAKATGTNLEKFLMLLSEHLGRNDITRLNITITNSWPKPLYLKEHNRSEALEQEIIQPDNLNRLRGELNAITDLVIFCGNRAKLIAKLLSLPSNPKFLYLPHLGGRGLLAIKEDINENEIVAADVQIARGRKCSKKIIQAENTNKRLEVAVSRLLEEIKNESLN